MELYNRSEAMIEAFGVFLDHCHRGFLDGVNGANSWTTIANGVHIPSAAQEGDIRSPVHRIIHRFISCSINMRKDDDKVPNLDLSFLWRIIIPNTFCNIPYCLAKYLAEGGVKDRNASRICGGMFVTKLVRSYGIFENGAGNFLFMIHTRPFSIILYKRDRIVEDNGGGKFSIPDDDEVEVPEHWEGE